MKAIIINSLAHTSVNTQLYKLVNIGLNSQVYLKCRDMLSFFQVCCSIVVLVI